VRGMHPRTCAALFNMTASSIYRILGRVPPDVEKSDHALLDLA
jgi:hypothetical protein